MSANEDRCTHREALQFTGSTCQWCPTCGSARYSVDDKAPRWKRPKATDNRAGRSGRPLRAVPAPAKRGRKPAAAVAKGGRKPKLVVAPESAGKRRGRKPKAESAALKRPIVARRRKRQSVEITSQSLAANDSQAAAAPVH